MKKKMTKLEKINNKINSKAKKAEHNLKIKRKALLKEIKNEWEKLGSKMKTQEIINLLTPRCFVLTLLNLWVI